MKHVATTSPEDYFRYICTDDVAKEMFDQYYLTKEDEVECLTKEVDEVCISELEGVIEDLEEQIEDLENQVRYLVEERDQLEYELNELEESKYD